MDRYFAPSRSLACCSFCWLLCSVVLAQQSDDPFAAKTNKGGPKWANRSQQVEKNGVRKLATISDRDAKITFAPAPTKYAVVDDKVIQLKDGTEIGTVSATLEPGNDDRALSPNGRYFAYEANRGHLMFVQLIDCKTGSLLHGLEYTKEKFQRVECLEFTKHNHLIGVVGAGSGSEVYVWRMSDGKVLRKLKIQRVDGSKVGFSTDGRYMAAAFSGTVDVFDLTKKK